MPLTIEPSKPRLCHDERFLSLWIKDFPFHLGTLKDMHQWIELETNLGHQIGIGLNSGTTKVHDTHYSFKRQSRGKTNPKGGYTSRPVVQSMQILFLGSYASEFLQGVLNYLE
jgi:hypothetical protein